MTFFRPSVWLYALAPGILLLAGSLPGIGEETPHPHADPWAGEVVKDAAHVNAMVPGRIHNAPRMGEPAPDILITEAATGRPIQLSRLHESRPLVLFFATYSCDCAQLIAEPVARLHRTFGDRFAFALVYIREAHPSNGFHTNSPFAIRDTNLFPDRAAAALRFARERGIGFPVFVDSMDDRHAVRWAAWPTRLFVVDRRGTVVYAGQQGPWFVKPLRGFEMNLTAIPEAFRDLPGYSRESLEEFLAEYPAEAETETGASEDDR